MTWRLADIEFNLGHYEEGRKVLSELINAVKDGKASLSFIEPQNLNNIARLLATHWDPEIRDGAEAIRWATKACDLTEGKKG